MQYTQRKFALWLALALGMVICIAGTVLAATPWHMSGYPNRVILQHGNHLADGTVPRANANVEVRSNRYLPASVTINVGDTVIWTRVEGFHNVLANDGSFRLGESPDGAPSSSWVTASHAPLSNRDAAAHQPVPRATGEAALPGSHCHTR